MKTRNAIVFVTVIGLGMVSALAAEVKPGPAPAAPQPAAADAAALPAVPPAAPMSGPVALSNAAAAPTQAVAAAAVPTPLLNPAQLLAEGDALQATNKPVEAREKYLAALDAKPNENTRLLIEERLSKLNVELVRKPWRIAEKADHIVQPGDAVKRIAQKYGCTVDLIVEMNGLAKPDRILPGKRLQVLTGKFAIVVNKQRNDLLLTLNGKFFKRYRIGTGKYGTTPVGAFVIGDRVKDPAWYREDGQIVQYGEKENILGTRWIALARTNAAETVKGYGIHGTWDNSSIGKAESSGCIRLRNDDVEELFLLVPAGTAVEIQE